MEKQLGCALPWRDHNKSQLQTCGTHAQFGTLLDLYEQIREKDEQKIYEQTGCLQGSKNEVFLTKEDCFVNLLRDTILNLMK